MKRFIIIAFATVMAVGAHAGNFVGNWAISTQTSIVMNGNGQNTWHFDTVRTGGSDTILPNSPIHFTTFCAELGNFISAGGQNHDEVEYLGYSGQTTVNGGVVFTNPRVDALRRLWYTGLTDVVLSGGWGGWSPDKFAAFQMAQWEILFDASWNLGAGSYNWTGSSATVLGIAGGWLSAAQSTNTAMATVVLMRDTEEPWIQDQLTGFIPGGPGGNSVPEPFTMGLCAAGAAAFVRRRMKAKSA